MTTLTVLSIIVIALVTLIVAAEVFGFAVLFWLLRGFLNRSRRQIGPLVDKGAGFLVIADHFARPLLLRTEHIAGKTANVTKNVSRQVEKYALQTERAIVTPVIAAHATDAGFRQFFATWRSLRRQRREQRMADRVVEVPGVVQVSPPAEIEEVITVEEAIPPREEQERKRAA
ncbi:MAG TPA: hypothetical protein VGM23_14870 [Armatimonadota bacterium]|jgi:hypothetical protein